MKIFTCCLIYSLKCTLGGCLNIEYMSTKFVLNLLAYVSIKTTLCSHTVSDPMGAFSFAVFTKDTVLIRADGRYYHPALSHKS